MRINRRSTGSVKKVLHALYTGKALIRGAIGSKSFKSVLQYVDNQDWDGKRFRVYMYDDIVKSCFDELIYRGLIDEVDPPRVPLEEDGLLWYRLSEEGRENVASGTNIYAQFPAHGAYAAIETKSGDEHKALFDRKSSRWWITETGGTVKGQDVSRVSYMKNPYPFFFMPGYFLSESMDNNIYSSAERLFLDSSLVKTDPFFKTVSAPDLVEHYNNRYAEFHLNKTASMIQIYEDKNGTAITTDATDEREFLEGMSSLLYESIVTAKHDEDWHGRIGMLLPQIVDMACKYRGYKSNVTEKRVLTTGRVLAGEPIAQTGSDAVVARGETA